jgi:hypothetical protein
MCICYDESMNEESSNSEYADLNERRSYHVTISGDDVMIPIQQFVELPVHLAESFIQAKRESVHTGTQETAIIEIVAHLNQQFPGVADGDFGFDDVTISPTGN